MKNAHRRADPFDIAWAREVLRQTLSLMEAECRATDRPDIWGVFHERILKPVMEQAEPLPYPSMVERFGVRSPRQAAHPLTTAKQTFQRALRMVVAAYAISDEEIEDEVRALTRILGDASADSRSEAGMF